MPEPEPTPIALAFVRRSFIEEEQDQKMLAVFGGLPFQPQTEKFKQRRLVPNAINIDNLLTAQDDEELLRVEREFRIWSSLRQNFEWLKQIPVLRGIPEVRLTSAAGRIARYEVAQYSDDDMLREAEFVIRQLSGIRSLAEEGGVSPETVFQETDLFEEAIRRALSPQEFAYYRLPWLDRIALENKENLESRLRGELILLKPSLNRPMFGGKRSSAPTLGQFIPIEFAPGTTPHTRRLAGSKVILYGVERFWGKAATRELSEELRQALLME